MKPTTCVVAVLLLLESAAGGLAAAKLVGGPMIGHTTDRSVRIWARSDSAGELVVAVSPNKDLSAAIRSKPVRTTAEGDFSGVAEIAGLASATRYWYDVLIDGKPQLTGERPSFCTYPPAGKPAMFRVMFGGCVRFQGDRNQVIWDEMLARQPLAMIRLGDNVYADISITDDHLKMAADLGDNVQYLKMKESDGMRSYVVNPADYRSMRVYYRIQESVPAFRRFTAVTPSYATWDDHDSFGEGGGRGTPPLDARLRMGIKVFAENFANPYYGGGEDAPGIWCHFSIADCDFFLLDARTYRNAPGNARRKPFLGAAEEKWLRDGLARSQARFKFIVCGSPWNNQSKRPGVRTTDENYYENHGDTLASFKQARDELFEFIIDKKIGGVILLSGDRHRADITKVWPKEKPQHVFYDFTNSSIASTTTAPAFKPGEEGLLHTWTGRCFGTLDIDTRAAPATVTYTAWGSPNGRPPLTRRQVFVLRATDFLPVPTGEVRTPND